MFDNLEDQGIPCKEIDPLCVSYSAKYLSITLKVYK